MPVLNIAQNVYTPSPVRAAIEGKAARIALESQKLQNTAMEQEIGAFDEREARAREGMEIQKQNAQVAMQRAQTDYLKMLNESTEDIAEKHRDIWARSHIQYQGAIEQGNEEAAAGILENALRETGAEDEEIEGAMQQIALVGPERFLQSQYATADKALRGEDMPAELETHQALVAAAKDPSDPVAQRAAQTALGLKARAMGNAMTTLAGPDPTADDVADVSATVRGGEEAGKVGIQMSKDALSDLGRVNQSIALIDEAIAALDEGANTGAVASKVPSVKSASVMLDNIQARMGLNIVGATTFGSLSESELAFALSTALPTGLSEPELKKWLKKKRSAQKKLATELKQMAEFLGTPGNTPAEYIQFMKDNGALEFKDKDEPKGGVVIKGHPQLGDVTEEDIQETMRAHGKTRAEVLELINGG